MKITDKSVKFFILVFLTLTLVFPQMTKAVDENLLQPPKIIPGTFKFKLERAWEKVYLSFLFSNKWRVNYHSKLLDKRFSELNYIVNNKDVSLMEDASNRFSYEAGVLEETLEFEDAKERSGTILKFTDYSEYLPKLRDEFPANSSNWLFIQQNIDTLNILSGTLKNQ